VLVLGDVSVVDGGCVVGVGRVVDVGCGVVSVGVAVVVVGTVDVELTVVAGWVVGGWLVVRGAVVLSTAWVVVHLGEFVGGGGASIAEGGSSDVVLVATGVGELTGASVTSGIAVFR
jgi:hypothetical protein